MKKRVTELAMPITLLRGLVLVLSFLPVLSCVHSTEWSGHKIDLMLKEEQDKLQLSEFCSLTDIIPLENKDEALLTPGALSSYKIHDGVIYILDKVSHKIQLFSLDGSYISTVSRYGNGPGEYNNENELFVNPFANTLDIVTNRGQIISYDITNPGKHVRTFDIAPDIKAVKNCFLHASGKGYFFYAPYSLHQLGYFDLQSNDVRYFDYKIDEKIVRSHYSISITPFGYNESEVLFMQSCSGKVFSLDEKTMKMSPYLLFDAGKYSYITDVEGDFKEMSHKMASPYNRFAECGRFVFSEFFFNEQWRTAIYDKQTGTCRSFRTTDDGTMFTLGQIVGNDMYLLVDPQFLPYYVKQKPITQDGNYILLKYRLW